MGLTPCGYDLGVTGEFVFHEGGEHSSSQLALAALARWHQSSARGSSSLSRQWPLLSCSFFRPCLLFTPIINRRNRSPFAILPLHGRGENPVLPTLNFDHFLELGHRPRRVWARSLRLQRQSLCR
jgi:hypothetical protein